MKLRFGFGLAFALLAIGVPGEVVFDASAVEIAQTVEDRKAVGDRLFQEGRELYRVSRWTEALSKWEQALEIFREIGDRAGIANALIGIGVIYAEQGEYGDALDYQQQSLAIKREIRDRAGIAAILGNIGIIYQEQGEYGEALDYYQKSLAIKREIGDRAGIAVTLGNIGNISQLQGEYGEALDYQQQSLALYREIGDRVGIALTLGNIGVIYQSQGEYGEALDYYQQGLAIFREIGDRSGIAKTLGNIGIIYKQQGEYGEALDYQQQSLALYREIGDRSGITDTLGNIGNIYQLQGEYEEALDYQQQSLALKREIGDRAGIANFLNNIGITYRLQGEYGEALDYQQQGLAIFREIGDRSGIAKTLNNISIIYQVQGEYGKALDYQQQSLAIFREIGDRSGIAHTLGNIGNIYQVQGEYGEALDYHQQSLTITRKIGNRPTTAITLGNIGNIYQLQGEYEEALDYQQQSLALKREIGDHSGIANSLGNIGIIYRLQGEYGEALDYQQQSLALKREIGDRSGIARTLHNLGYLLETQNEPELAIIFFKQAVNTYESIRESNQSLSQDLQESYLATIEDTYRRLADLLLQEGRVLEAQRVIDLLKVQELDDFLRGVRGSEDSREGIELLEPERIIIEEYNAIVDRAITNGRSLVTLEQKKLAGIALTPQENQQFDTLQAESRAILQLFVSFLKSPEVVAKIALLRQEEGERTIYPRQLRTLQDNLQRLQQNAVLLYPLILEDRLEIVLVTPYADPIHRPVSVTANQLNTTIRDFRSALDDPSQDALTPARKLYQWLIEPIESDLQAAGAETLIYSPDRTLRYIPLAALHDGEQWLIERFRINHITAATLSDFNVQPRKQPRILAGAFANGEHVVTVGDKQFPFSGLPYAEIEVEGLKKLTQNLTSLFDRDFSRQTIEREANSHTIVHFATHAKFLIGTPRDSFILFGDGSRVTLQDIDDTGWLSLTNVDLIVLSACETGLDNTFGNGAEILGFGYLMQQPVGARASMASLWAVDDGGTQVLMDAFYKALMSGDTTTAEALQQAQVDLIRAGEGGDVASGDPRGGFRLLPVPEGSKLNPANLGHPHYWAPFILIGNGL